MTIITAIRSLLTPAKHYSNNSVNVVKKLQRDGSLLVQTFDKKGTLLKSLVRTPIDQFNFNHVEGNSHIFGHKTVIHNIYDATVTEIQNFKIRYEKPIYNGLNPKEKIADSGEAIRFFNKVTKRKDTFVGTSFHLKQYPHLEICTKFIYDSMGKILFAKKSKINK